MSVSPVPYITYAEAIQLKELVVASKTEKLTLHAVIEDTIEGEQLCFFSHKQGRWCSVRTGAVVNKG